MHPLPLHKFRKYDFDRLHAYLLETKESEFEIIIKRLTTLKSEEDAKNYGHIYHEYTVAAYAGFKLQELSRSFGYRVPTVFKLEPFRFAMVVDDMEKFAKLLLLLIEVCDPKERLGKQRHFRDEGVGILGKQRASDLCTFGLVSVAQIYFTLKLIGPDYINRQKNKL